MLKKRFFSLFGVLCVTTAAVLPQAAHAIITYGNDNLNIAGPTGEYASIGYQYMGHIQIPVDDYNTTGLGNVVIPISEHWALQATHVAANPGNVITFNGSNHTIVERQQVTYQNSSGQTIGTDLTLVRVDNAFANYVYLYDPTQDNTTELGLDAVLVGGANGSKNLGANGMIYSTNPATGAQLWNGWDVDDNLANVGKLSWGRNRIEAVRSVYGTETLYTTFDQPFLADGSPNPAYIGGDEATAYSGDSGGGMFVLQNGQWRLAGQIYAVDAVSLTNGGQENIMGPVFDARNLWTKDEDGNWVQIEDPNPVPLGTYASRISAYRSQIDAITGETRGLGSFSVVPEAGTAPLMLGAMGFVFGVVRLRRRK